ncbi:YbhB/YbcL family Raf kinase inhibitor-like protein [Paradevosia shaoguanensis]|uniref:YbhB/YbcL family Raf kinase inhibitor-like protein n=1 Tax=Paradevosia shaoguanensis TaxID=1335043 RepID=UPI003C7460C4
MRHLALAATLFAVASLSPLAPAQAQQAAAARPPAMVLTIPAFPDGTDIPPQFTQAGENVEAGKGTSPQISWENVPEGTQSFVLHLHDIDVARSKTSEDQLHWLVWNIPATATELPEGVPENSPLADGSLQTSASGPYYRGPGAPASGPRHHYVFELYALDTKLDVTSGEDGFADRTKVMEAMQGHILGKAIYVGLFKRPS